MSDVFISYKREDEARVYRLAQALERAGLSVWSDHQLAAAENFRDNIAKALAEARCVMVVWSSASVGEAGDFVRDEDSRGKARGVLVPVRIDPVHPPLGFGELQAIDLTRWRGGAGYPFFQDLVGAIRAKLDGRPAPKPKGPAMRVARRLLYGGLSSAGVAAVGAFTFNTFDLAGMVCRTPGLQPGLSDFCGACRLGGRPTRQERLAWESRPAGSCQALRDHIARFPEGAYRREAADLLTARRVSTEEVWTAGVRSLALFQGQESAPASSQAAAEARALASAQAKAESLCRGFAATTAFRFIAAAPKAQTWNCSPQGGGFVCGFDGEASCTLQERASVEHEACGPLKPA